MRVAPRKLLQISRPKFWVYLLGPYFLGATLAIERPGQLLSWQFWALFAWFTLPANLLLYGVNDACDYDTDRHNPKKAGGEALVHPGERPALLAVIVALGLLALPPLLATNSRVVAAVALFVALSLAYSVPPLRLKARPGLDSLSNALYLTPLLAGWAFYSPVPPPFPLAVAGAAWCAAMHAYSAIPDIEADTRAGLRTIATLLGRDRALLFCAAGYGLAAVLAARYDALAGLLLGAYPAVMALQLLRAKERVARWYVYFPLLNGFVGMCLTLRFLWPVVYG
jgi:4-hydroxybenzoate polyprenyltransferase